VRVSIPWKRDISGWFEVSLLSGDDLDQATARLNRILRPEGHLARVLQGDDGRVFIGVRVCADQPARVLERLLRLNEISAYFSPLDPPCSPCAVR
jgi:hypothetical protein